MERSGKSCSYCGDIFWKRPRDSGKQWVSRSCCSIECSNREKAKTVESLEDRLERYIVRIPEAGCWIWVGAHDGRYYGHMATKRGMAPVKAHRVSYELFVGAIPKGMVVRHRCDVPACVNPHHLEMGTQKQNMQDMVNRGRLNQSILKNLTNNHVRSFTAEQALEIRRLFDGGCSQASIARKFGVDRSTVGLYINGKR